uniref:Uncharacterized protein n=1 Tax=viral metagenome TaxID=1070528 RepID=A0A6M3KRS0_9ZZZZ
MNQSTLFYMQQAYNLTEYQVSMLAMYSAPSVGMAEILYK